jgi:hypothetical protein
MMDIAVGFYKNIFTKQDSEDVRLGVDFLEESSKVNSEEMII